MNDLQSDLIQTGVEKEAVPPEIFFDKHADKIASISAVIPFLSLAAIAGVILTVGLSSIPGVIISTAAIGSLILALILLFYSSSAIAAEEKNITENTRYVISYWSIETLKASGVPEDLIKTLKEILLEPETISPSKEISIKDPSDDSPHNWLKKLKERHGEIRVKEFSEVILKYTRRDVPENDQSN